MRMQDDLDVAQNSLSKQADEYADELARAEQRSIALLDASVADAVDTAHNTVAALEAHHRTILDSHVRGTQGTRRRAGPLGEGASEPGRASALGRNGAGSAANRRGPELAQGPQSRCEYPRRT